jgi:hypothetical protein
MLLYLLVVSIASLTIGFVLGARHPKTTCPWLNLWMCSHTDQSVGSKPETQNDLNLQSKKD